MSANIYYHTSRRGTTIVPLLALLMLALLGSQDPLLASKTIGRTQAAHPELGGIQSFPIAFEAYASHTSSPAFVAHNRAQTFVFTASGLTLLVRPDAPTKEATGTPPESVAQVGIDFADANPAVELLAGETLPGTVNYLMGNNPTHWRTGLRTFKSVDYVGLYPGIDLKYEGKSGQMEGTYTVAPGADATSIRWRYSMEASPPDNLNAGAISLEPSGDLAVSLDSTPAGSYPNLTEFAPVAWQLDGITHVPVSVQYVIYSDQSVSFKVGPHDITRPLIIDPTLAYSTHLGGSLGDSGIAIAVDSSGNTYVSGSTSSPDFPSMNPLQPSFGGATDVFVTKINAAGTALVYSTYLGGSGEEVAWGTEVDSSGSAYVSGWTSSTNFPTANPFQPSNAGGRDAFVAELSPDGSGLVYSTYLGGSQNDGAWDVAISGGYAYAAGETLSTDFPTTNPLQPTNRGGKDIFVTRLSRSGTSLVYSTYLGGTADDTPLGVTADAAGDLFVTGGSFSTDYPVRSAFQPNNRGGEDIVLSKINPAGTALVYSTYLGGSGAERAWDVAVSPQGDAYLTGVTDSPDFPTRRPVQATKGLGDDGFVTRLAPSGSWIVYSTYLGGNGQFDAPYGIALDGQGRAFISSLVSSTDFPVVNAIQPTYGGGVDASISMLSPLGAPLQFSTYLGGTGEDFAWRTAVDGQGNVYVTGQTGSSNFPLANPLQPNLSGESDAFVTKITGLPGPTVAPTICPIQFTDVITGSTFYPYIGCLACEGIVAGYEDGTFRPNSPINRGQLAKIVANAAGFNDSITGQTFEDVPSDSAFHDYIERLALRWVVSGYPCGGVGEPCILPGNRPYFRPGANLTRSQAAKIVAATAAFADPPVGERIFEDIPTTSPFYRWTEEMASLGIVSGYPCGGITEPCLAPQNRPYFRPGGNITRGQAAKLVANTFLAECVQAQAAASSK